jgi:REP element-mobilizing transposase RayT
MAGADNTYADLSRDRSSRSARERSVTYLITFVCYGCHLHGQESGSVDRRHNQVGSRMLDSDPKQVSAERQRMDQPRYDLDRTRREAVLASLRERCSQNHWTLLAAHVRGNHVHVVVEAEARPERIMNDLKAYASRCLNGIGLDQPNRKRWARHGSTKWLWKREDVSTAIRYVVEGQGDVMAVFEATEPWGGEAATAPSGHGSA